MTMESWLSEYDELAEDVESSGYQTFSLQLQRWLDFVDQHPLVRPYIALWENSVNFGEWYTNALLTQTTDDPGKLDWPREQKQRIALQFGLFRDLASGQLDVSEFAHAFFVTPNDYDSQVAHVVKQLFKPFARELRRTIPRLDLQNPPTIDDAQIPASDRIVRLDHNSSDYIALTDGLRSMGEQIGRLNDYPDPAAKERHAAELSAGQWLLKSTTVRVITIATVLIPVLRWIANAFGEGSIGYLAEELLKLLGSMFGLG